VLEQSIHLAR